MKHRLLKESYVNSDMNKSILKVSYSEEQEVHYIGLDT